MKKLRIIFRSLFMSLYCFQDVPRGNWSVWHTYANDLKGVKYVLWDNVSITDDVQQKSWKVVWKSHNFSALEYTWWLFSPSLLFFKLLINVKFENKNIFNGHCLKTCEVEKQNITEWHGKRPAIPATSINFWESWRCARW